MIPKVEKIMFLALADLNEVFEWKKKWNKLIYMIFMVNY